MENLKNIKDLKEFSHMILSIIEENERLTKRCSDLEDRLIQMKEEHTNNNIQSVNKVHELLLNNFDYGGVLILIEKSIDTKIEHWSNRIEISQEIYIDDLKEIIQKEFRDSFQCITEDLKHELIEFKVNEENNC